MTLERFLPTPEISLKKGKKYANKIDAIWKIWNSSQTIHHFQFSSTSSTAQLRSVLGSIPNFPHEIFVFPYLYTHNASQPERRTHSISQFSCTIRAIFPQNFTPFRSCYRSYNPRLFFFFFFSLTNARDPFVYYCVT